MEEEERGGEEEGGLVRETPEGKGATVVDGGMSVGPSRGLMFIIPEGLSETIDMLPRGSGRNKRVSNYRCRW